MLMLTVLDLLAKFAYGDAEGQVCQRFKRLLTEPSGANLSRDQAEIFWSVRNSLVHSFGLPHEAQRSRLKLGDIGAWRRHPSDAHICAEGRDDQVVLYLDGVYARVLRVIKWSHDVAQQDPNASQFVDMFAKYGAVFFALE